MIKLSCIYLSIVLVHLGFVNYKILPGELKPMLLIDGFLLLLFILGMFLTLPVINVDPEAFSLRFLMMTTFQMLLMLSLIVYFVFSKIPNSKTLGFSSVLLFILLLVVQSVYLVRNIKKN